MDRLGIDTDTGSLRYYYMLHFRCIDKVGYVKGHFRFLFYVFPFFFLIEYCCLRRRRSIQMV